MGLDMAKTLGYTGAEWGSILDREDDPRFQKKKRVIYLKGHGPYGCQGYRGFKG